MIVFVRCICQKDQISKNRQTISIFSDACEIKPIVVLTPLNFTCLIICNVLSLWHQYFLRGKTSFMWENMRAKRFPNGKSYIEGKPTVNIGR